MRGRAEVRMVHLHEPKTGGHACGARVPHEFVSMKSRRTWSVSGSQVRRKGLSADILDLSEEYLGGEWCCSNLRREVTCPRCVEIMDGPDTRRYRLTVTLADGSERSGEYDAKEAAWRVVIVQKMFGYVRHRLQEVP